MSANDFSGSPAMPVAQGYHLDFALHTLGWKAFQDLCAQICQESFGRPAAVYREAQDGGQDAVLVLESKTGMAEVTVQCKFSSKADQRLKLSDINTELSNVEGLVAAGRAFAYYFITSMGVDAPIAADIRSELFKKGVQEPHVLGREWIIGEIRKSAKLRALVPRVYGLGDLSMIVDERSASQTRALLAHLLPGLRVYVPTSAHRTAVRILADHKLVLLLGPPAVGKSMLAAILSTMAIDSHQLECFKCEGPLNMQPHWNPAEAKRLFWIDDAFGPNQVREDYVNAWIEFMPKMKAAIDQGNHFILTSRAHIWNEAVHKLGTRNHPILSTRRGIVEVGRLSPEERQQILYNHIKAGTQPKGWKARVKPHLDSLSDDVNLFPEIARRLADPNYTSGIRNIPADLSRFVRAPQEFLEETFKELSVPQQAAMTLVFLFRSQLRPPGVWGDEAKLVAEKYGTSVAGLAQSLEQLERSFLVKREDPDGPFWSFFHPTFADAVSSILSARPDLVDLYLTGARLEAILAEAVCEGAPAVADAVLVPARCFDTLVLRLLETPDERESNERLFRFLNRRAPDSIVEQLVRADGHILERHGAPSIWTDVGRQAEVLLHARAHSLGLLPAPVRDRTCELLQHAAEYSFDVSFLSDDAVLSMFDARRLLALSIKLVGMLREQIPAKISKLAEEADADADIDDQFSRVESFVKSLDSASDYELSMTEQLGELEQMILDAKAEVESRKSKEDSESFFSSVPSATVPKPDSARSIYSDIDE